MKIIKIRLGGNCNKNCSFCHSKKTDNYEFNPKLIPFIKYNHYEKINYGGGEPLMYWQHIKKFINIFPKLKHHVVTNGTLFNEEMLEYTKNYRFRIGLSLNEFTKLNQHTIKLLSEVPELGYGICYSGNKTLDELDKMMDDMNKLLNKQVYACYNLMHSIYDDSIKYTDQQIKEYLDGIEFRINNFLNDYIHDIPNRYENLVLHIVDNNRNKIPGCSNRGFTSVSLDGRFMECTYNLSYTKTIEDDIPYPVYNKEECFNCNLKRRCISCSKSINNDECYIYNELDKILSKYLNKYNLDRDVLYNNLVTKGRLNINE